MNTIEPTYVSFEQAKWLKEKGYKSKSRYYDGSGKLVSVPNISGNDYRHTNNYMQRFRWEAPEQWEVVEWFEQRFNVYIDTRCVNSTRGDNFEFCIHKMNDIIETKNGFNTRQEAYSAALDYINENNLI